MVEPEVVEPLGPDTQEEQTQPRAEVQELLLDEVEQKKVVLQLKLAAPEAKMWAEPQGVILAVLV